VTKVKTSSVRMTYHGGTFVQPLLQWESITYYILLEYLYSFKYPACNAHAPYCHLWPARLCIVFPYYFITGM